MRKSILFIALFLPFAAQSAEQPARIPLWPNKPPASVDDFIPTLEPHLLPGDKPRGAVIVIPGGGYGGRAEHERTPIAQFFNDAGLHAFILDYRVAPNRHPAPLLDACRAVRIVRSRAAEWHVKPDKIAALGFSAGGHLTGSLGLFYDAPYLNGLDPQQDVSARPDAIVLCYPVISSAEFGHQGSFNNLLGPDATDEAKKALSLELHARKDGPPAFIWHTADDEGVPVRNSLEFAKALREQGVPFEMHIYPHGKHGLGLAKSDPHIATWSTLCAEWLKGMGW
jgi:acetyl esterase/lipase